jgi:hypothetical protein
MCRASSSSGWHSSSSAASASSLSSEPSAWYSYFTTQCRLTGVAPEAVDGGKIVNWLKQNGTSMPSLRMRERAWMQLAAAEAESSDVTGLFAETKPKLHVEARRLR